MPPTKYVLFKGSYKKLTSQENFSSVFFFFLKRILNRCIQINTFSFWLYQQIKPCWTTNELVIDLYPEINAERSSAFLPAISSINVCPVPR